MSNLKPCPLCGNEMDTNDDSKGCSGKYYLSCMGPDCGMEGPARKTLALAIDACNARHRQGRELVLEGLLRKADQELDSMTELDCPEYVRRDPDLEQHIIAALDCADDLAR